ncbi:hypothetical protein GA586_08405, partial [Bifidobacterium adolescentis]
RTQDAGHALLRQGRNPKVRKNSGVITVFCPLSEKKRQPFLVSLSNTELLEICQKWAQKKQQIFFGFTALCAAAGWRLFNFKMKHHLMIGLFLCGCQRKSQKLSIIIYIRIFSSIFM